jgi:hypothetical protein
MHLLLETDFNVPTEEMARFQFFPLDLESVTIGQPRGFILA